MKLKRKGEKAEECEGNHCSLLGIHKVNLCTAAGEKDQWRK